MAGSDNHVSKGVGLGLGGCLGVLAAFVLVAVLMTGCTIVLAAVGSSTAPTAPAAP